MGDILRVLLVEDSEDDALLLSRLLRRGGYELKLQRVDTASEMRAALAHATWDLIISDYSIPSFGGRDALEILKESGLDIPFILVSGAIGEEIAIAAMKAGAHDYLMKNKLSRLVPAVRRELKEARMRAERRNAEAQVRKLSRAIEQNLASVIITDAEGHIEYVNPQFVRLTGHVLDEVRGHIAFFVTEMRKELGVGESITNREWKGEFSGQKKSGETYWVSAAVSQIYDSQGNVTHLVAIEEDITLRKQEEFERTRREVRRRRQQAAFIYLATHAALAEGRPEAFRIIAEKMAEVLQIEHVSLWRLPVSGEAPSNLTKLSGSDTPIPITIPISEHSEYLSPILAGQIVESVDLRLAPLFSEQFTADWLAQQIVSMLIIPVRLHGEIAGVICCGHAEPRLWQEDEKGFAVQIAGLVAQTLLNADLRRRANELAIITRISREITLVPDLHKVLKVIAQNAAELLHADTGGMFTFRADGRLYVEEFYGVDEILIRFINTRGIGVGQGCIGKAVETRQPIQMFAASSEPICSNAPISFVQHVRSVLAVPILQEERALGGIVLWYHQLHRFSQGEIAFIQALAQQCVNAVANAQLFDAEARRRREAETLYTVVQALSSTLNLSKVLELIISELQKVVPYDSASIQRLEDDHLVLIDGRGFPNLEQLIGKEFDLNNSDLPNYKVMHTLSPVILNEMEHRYGDFQHPHSWLGVPLVFNEQPLGMLALDKHEPHFYTEEHARMALAFATQAAIAMENARLFAEEEQRSQALAAALEQQRELDRLKDEFIQNVSHELRTPLAIARGYAELLYDEELGPLSPGQKQPLSIIVRRLQMLTKLVGDISATMEVESRHEHRELVDLVLLAQMIAEEFRSSMERKGVKLEYDIAPSLPPVMGDPVHLRRVLDNLLGNALKFTSSGGKVSLSLRREGDFARLDVSDTGIGIPADQLERIFIRFYQVDGSSRRRYGGAGLGLSLVKEIAESMGGSVSVSSTVGEGSTFTVKLPFADETAAQSEEDADAPEDE